MKMTHCACITLTEIVNEIDARGTHAKDQRRFK